MQRMLAHYVSDMDNPHVSSSSEVHGLLSVIFDIVSLLLRFDDSILQLISSDTLLAVILRALTVC